MADDRGAGRTRRQGPSRTPGGKQRSPDRLLADSVYRLACDSAVIRGEAVQIRQPPRLRGTTPRRLEGSKVPIQSRDHVPLQPVVVAEPEARRRDGREDRLEVEGKLRVEE